MWPQSSGKVLFREKRIVEEFRLLHVGKENRNRQATTISFKKLVILILVLSLTIATIETQTYRDLLHKSTVTSKAAHATFNQYGNRNHIKKYIYILYNYRKYSEQVQALNQFEHQFQKERTLHNK